LKPFLEKASLEVNVEVLLQITPLVQTRIKTLGEVVEFAGFFFHEQFIPPSPDKLPQKKMDVAQTITALKKSAAVLDGLADFTFDTQHAAFETLAKELGLSNGQLFGTLRVAVTGQQISTPLFETMVILGKEESLARIKLAIKSLEDSEQEAS
jgi:glutamyl-tRNA synthetase